MGGAGMDGAAQYGRARGMYLSDHRAGCERQFDVAARPAGEETVPHPLSHQSPMPRAWRTGRPRARGEEPRRGGEERAGGDGDCGDQGTSEGWLRTNAVVRLSEFGVSR